jgi:hypothetical protein
MPKNIPKNIIESLIHSVAEEQFNSFTQTISDTYQNHRATYDREMKSWYYDGKYHGIIATLCNIVRNSPLDEQTESALHKWVNEDLRARFRGFLIEFKNSHPMEDAGNNLSEE